MEKILTNKVCLITGASKGIGLSIAETFAKAGAIVYANVRTLESVSDELKQLTVAFANLKLCAFDVTDAEAMKATIIEIKKESGKIDVLVNNAGVVSYELLPFINFDKLHEMLEVNVVAVIRITQLVSRVMARQKSGSIINISSIVGVKGVKGQLAYSATKGALNAVTLSAAKELAEYGIRVNAIAPGMVGTERLKGIIADKFKEQHKEIALGRIAEPEEVANTCLFLASDLSSYITGQVLGVDGGLLI